jgi:hypothetical protein
MSGEILPPGKNQTIGPLPRSCSIREMNIGGEFHTADVHFSEFFAPGEKPGAKV